MIPILVHSASASLIEYVVKMIEHYFLMVATFEMMSHMNFLATGSIPVEGSSKNMTLGLPKYLDNTQHRHGYL